MRTQVRPLLKDATLDDSNHQSGPAPSCARRCELSNISCKRAILPISNHEKGQASSDAPRCDLMNSPSASCPSQLSEKSSDCTKPMPSVMQMQLESFSTADSLIRGYSTYHTPTDKIRAPQDGKIVQGTKGIENIDAQNDAQKSTPQ